MRDERGCISANWIFVSRLTLGSYRISMTLKINICTFIHVYSNPNRNILLPSPHIEDVSRSLLASGERRGEGGVSANAREKTKIVKTNINIEEEVG